MLKGRVETRKKMIDTEQVNINRAIYNQNIQLLKVIKGDDFDIIKNEVKAQIESLPIEDLIIKERQKELSEFNAMFWNNIQYNIPMLSSVSELLDRVFNQDDHELSFRLKVKKLQYAKVKKDNKTAEAEIEKIVNDVSKLNHNIAAVANQAKLIEMAHKGHCWYELSFKDMLIATDILAPLMKYKFKNQKKALSL